MRVALAELDRRSWPRAGASSTWTTTPGGLHGVATDLANEVVKRSGIDRDRVLGAGVAVSGPIDQETGTLGSTTIMPGWVGLDVGR